MFTKEEARQRQNESNERCRRRREARQFAAEPMPPDHEKFTRIEARESLSDFTLNAATGFDEARRREAQRLAARMLIEQLEGRERRVIEARFGLDGNEPLTFREIGAELGITGNRAMQIEQKAIRKLRHPFWREAVGDLFHYFREPRRKEPPLRERDDYYRAAFKRRLDALYPNWRAEEAKRRAEAMARIAADKTATAQQKHEAIIAERRAYQEALIAAERNRIAAERAAMPPPPPAEPVKKALTLADFTWKTGH